MIACIETLCSLAMWSNKSPLCTTCTIGVGVGVGVEVGSGVEGSGVAVARHAGVTSCTGLVAVGTATVDVTRTRT
jgi:hypothetical protein